MMLVSHSSCRVQYVKNSSTQRLLTKRPVGFLSVSKRYTTRIDSGSVGRPEEDSLTVEEPVNDEASIGVSLKRSTRASHRNRVTTVSTSWVHQFKHAEVSTDWTTLRVTKLITSCLVVLSVIDYEVTFSRQTRCQLSLVFWLDYVELKPNEGQLARRGRRRR